MASKEYFRQWRAKHPGYFNAVVKRYMQTDKGKATQLRYAKSDKAKARRNEQMRLRRAMPENRIKILAHQMVQKAIRMGELSKQPCEICGKTKSLAHHDDYRKPLKVRWFCYFHHWDYHQKLTSASQ